jgi:predicted phage tail protein
MEQVDREHTVYLHGLLGKKYGKKPISIYGYNLQDVFKGLSCRFGNEFKERIKSGMWHITTGKRETKSDKPVATDNFRGEEEVEMFIDDNEIHVFPQVAGAGGVGRIILGVILIIVGVVLYWIGGLYLTAIGVAMIGAGIGSAAGGITQLMTKSPKMGNYQAAEISQRPSFLFNGVVNTVEQGGPVPLVYGRHLTGSTVISAGMTVEQI